MTVAYLKDMQRVHAPGTVKNHGDSLQQFVTFLKSRSRKTPRLDALSRQTLADFWTWLTTIGGRWGSGIASNTARRRIRHVEAFWSWVDDHDDYDDVPRARKPMALPKVEHSITEAPTWAQMDACIASMTCEWHRQLATILRFTGLRPGSVMALRWSDVDLDEGAITLTVDKNDLLRRVPVSPHLVAIMAGWGRREGYVIRSGRRGGSVRERQARARDAGRAWARAGVSPEVAKDWKAFRAGFQSEMVAAGVSDRLLDYLVGHNPTTTRDRFYLARWALPLAEVVEKIPPLGGPDNVVRLNVTEEG